MLEQALARAVARVARSAGSVGGRLPHITEGGRWTHLSPLEPDPSALTGLPWTGGFVAGQLWLAGVAGEAQAVTSLLAPRAAQANTHDLGFLFWPSAVLGWLVTGEESLRELAFRAARSLAARRLPSGVIQVIGELDDPGARGRTIADTLPNLLLLWWAERQGDAAAGEVARSHVQAALRAYIRPDGSTYHSVRFADDGSVVERGSVNGYADGSTWARGQAWAIHGLVSAYRATGDEAIRDAADRAARWFWDHLPADGIPPWDFDDPAGEPRDASAAAIVASALLDLGRRDDALPLLDALVERCENRGDGDGLLLHCCYRRRVGVGLDCATAWGDFFYLNALIKAAASAHVLDLLGSQPGGPGRLPRLHRVE